MEKIHEQLHLDKLSFVECKLMGIATSFPRIFVFFEEGFKCGDGAKS
jgi:hypothetical protein